MSNNWENVILSPRSTLKQALNIINTETARCVLVADDEFNLLGVVTDGDIRRGLLSGKGLDNIVSDVMNSAPITAEKECCRDELNRKMRAHNILFIPILNEGIIVGLETLNSHLVNKQSYSNPIFIMAGGLGTRLKPLTDNCPKPMLKIGDKPILHTTIEQFVKAGFNQFYISTHYMPEKIHQHFGDGSDLGISITYVHEEIPLGTGGALGLLPDDMPKDLPLIMINGDILTKLDFAHLLKFHVNNDASATVCVREYDYQIPYGVINGNGNKIISMIEKPIQRFFVNAGIYVLSQQVITLVGGNQKIDMPELLEQILEKQMNVLMFPIHEYWLDIGRMDDFNRAKSDIVTLGI